MKKILIILISLLTSNNISAQKYTETYIKDANEIGIQWWEKVNNRNYKDSYSMLSNVLKNRFSYEKWLNQISILIDEFGDIKDRKVKDTYFQSELKDYENGFYVMIEYDVIYSKTKNHTENILLKQSDDLNWEIFDFNYSFQSLE